jgi:predicted dehydrogenase
VSAIGIAVVGRGPAAEPHARSLLDLTDRAEVRSAASGTERRARAFAERFPIPVTTEIAKAISDPAVDAVIVLTPPNAHLEVAEQCVRAGKHVLVEKPLDVSVARAKRLSPGFGGVRNAFDSAARFRNSFARMYAEGGRTAAPATTTIREDT